MPILRTVKNYLKAFAAKGVFKLMARDSQIVYMVLNCHPRKIAPRVILPATDYVSGQIRKHFKVKEFGKTFRGEYNNVTLSIIESGVGAPITAMTMEALKRAEVKSIIRVDYCGGLTKDIEVGDIVLCTEAICGDGTTPHYFNMETPYIHVFPDSNLTALIKEDLESHKIQFHEGPVWTHDALFQEPPELIKKAADQGAIAIDMETSVVFGLGKLFNVPAASVLVTTDNPATGETFLEKNTLSSRIFQNLDRVIDRILAILSSVNS
ncbi:MAG TPA: hypothetical protein VMV49_04570 [Candidatus Deferrimicrobium sp.]|nr:hypothetical protein [Candidatus Deferrimicrobium sp.]